MTDESTGKAHVEVHGEVHRESHKEDGILASKKIALSTGKVVSMTSVKNSRSVSADPPSDPGDRKGIQSIEVGYRLLDALLESERPMTLTALSVATGMPPSKCHVYLTSFIKVGLITQKESGGLYDLGPSSLRLGLAALARVDALQEARQVMYKLRDELQETVVLSVWGNRGPTIVYKEDGARWSPISVRVGTVLPVLSATGLALLSGTKPEALNELLAAELASTPDDSPWKLASVEEIHALLADVRAHGVSKGRGNIFPGYSGICSPVYDHEGGVCAALMVMGEIPRFDRSKTGPNALALREAAAQASHRIGWKGRLKI
jgi:DNA-binding IclR family transcriptional regulator